MGDHVRDGEHMNCTNKFVSMYDTFKLLTLLKNAEPNRAWLKQVDSKVLQLSLNNLDRAYKNFFAKRSKYPRFKSRHHHRQTYSTDINVSIIGDRIKLPKLGLIKFVRSRKLIAGRIIKATVTHTASDKYFVSIVVKGEECTLENGGGEIGIDVGIKSFCTDSFGRVVDNPRPLKKLSKRLKTEQRRLSKKQPGSRNREKQRIELAGAISDTSWGEFFRQLDYKSRRYGCTVLKVPTAYPSSQTCIFWLKHAHNTVGHTGIYACGEGIRRNHGAILIESRILTTWGLPNCQQK